MVEILLSDESVRSSGIDVSTLSQFLIPGGDDQRKPFDAQLTAATSALKKYQAELEQEMSVLYRQKRIPELPPVAGHARDAHRILRVLAEHVVEAWDVYRQVRQPEVQTKHSVIVQMLTLLDYIKQKKLRILPNLEQLQDRKGGHSQERKHYEAVKAALKRETAAYLANVDEFADETRSVKAVRAYIDAAIARREAGELYFDAVENEDRVMAFLEGPNSPLTKAHLLPISIDHNFDQVIAWIESAVTTLAKWEGTHKYDRRTVMYVMMARLLFDNLHQQLSYQQTASASTEELSKDEEVQGWFDRAQFAVCPIDAAYAVAMAHKVMCDRASNCMNPFECEEDMSVAKMSEVVRKSDLVDAASFVKWLREWSRLSGFSANSIAAIGFLESELKLAVT